MFKKKKAAAIVMTAMLGVSGIGGSMTRNEAGAMPIVNNTYVLPDDYEVGDEEQGYLYKLRNDEIDVDAQIYDVYDDDGEPLDSECTLLVVAADKGWLQLARELLEAGADVTLVNSHADNAVILAASNQNIEMLRLLHYFRPADVEAHINDVNGGLTTALTAACELGVDSDLVSLLVSWGAAV